MSRFYSSVVVLSSLFAVLAADPAKAQQTAAADSTPRAYSINPSTGAAGKTFGVVVQGDDTCGAKKHLEGMEILAVGDITIKNQKVQSGCLLTGTVTISESAKLGERVLPIVRNEGNTDKGEVGIVKFDVTPVEARPIPPRLEPQVDLMWKILPKNVVGDNFGGRIKRRYYAVEAMIGNNSAFDLQIAGVGFSMSACILTGGSSATLKPMFNCKAFTNEKSFRKLPSDSYQIVRGSLEREDQYGHRHLALGGIKALGLLMTGVLPFLDTPLSDAPAIANFLNGPVQKGFEVLFPRTTLRQLQRLEIQALHDGLIIPHNAQRRALAFLAKDVVGLEKPDRNDPQKVMARLGEMVLVGRQVDYLNRVQVVSQGSGAIKPPLVTTQLLEEVEQGDTDEARRVVGRNLAGANVIAQNEALGLTISEIKSDATGLFMDFKVTAKRDATLGRQTLLVSNTDGVFPVAIEVAPAVPAPAAKTYTIAGNSDSVDMTITGAKLKDIQSIQAIDSGAVVTGLTFTKDGTATDQSSKWKAKALSTLDRTADKTYKLRLTYTQGKTLDGDKSKLQLKVVKKPAATASQPTPSTAAAPSATAQVVTVAAGVAGVPLSLQGTNLTAITALKAVRGGQDVTEITFAKQGPGTAAAVTWQATIAATLDRSAEQDYDVQFLHGTPPKTVKNTGVKLKVAKN